MRRLEMEAFGSFHNTIFSKSNVKHYCKFFPIICLFSFSLPLHREKSFSIIHFPYHSGNYFNDAFFFTLKLTGIELQAQGIILCLTN